MASSIDFHLDDPADHISVKNSPISIDPLARLNHCVVRFSTPGSQLVIHCNYTTVINIHKALGDFIQNPEDTITRKLIEGEEYQCKSS